MPEGNAHMSRSKPIQFYPKTANCLIVPPTFRNVTLYMTSLINIDDI